MSLKLALFILTIPVGWLLVAGFVFLWITFFEVMVLVTVGLLWAGAGGLLFTEDDT